MRRVNDCKNRRSCGTTARLYLYGLKVNPAKAEYLESGTQTDGTVNIGGTQLKKVDGDITPDVRARVIAAWLKWRQVTGVLCDRRMPIRLEAKIYRSVVRPVALFGCECWPAAASHERMLHAMKMRMLRWSLGLTRLDHVTNNDTRTRLKVAPITEKMRQARLRWYGHVMRRDEQCRSPEPHSTSTLPAADLADDQRTGGLTYLTRTCAS